jgi:hypothetical protein
LTILAAWFISEIRLDWIKRYQYQPDWLAHYQLAVLPALSVANIRELLQQVGETLGVNPGEIMGGYGGPGFIICGTNTNTFERILI